VSTVATVFLTGRECPWRCVFCDLWKHTTAEDTPVGAIPRQLDLALAGIGLCLPRPGTGAAKPRAIKLYNAGSFFDPRAVPLADYEAIAERLSSFAHVVVESHPALVGERVDRLLRALARHRDAVSPAVNLEIAMGLETADPHALAALHKGMTVDQFASAAEWLGRRGVLVRAFLLVPPPFVTLENEGPALRQSIAFAFAAGASVVSLIPTRSGNGAMEALVSQGLARTPSLHDLEQALGDGLPEPRGRVFADLWDLDRLTECALCLPARRERLRSMNHTQAPVPPVACSSCGAGRAG
jgi:hypothetical protein